MIYVIHSIGLILAVSRKAASTAISNCYKTVNIKEPTLEAVIELKKSNWKVVGIVRDPLDRFESAYNFFQYGQCGNFPTGKYRSIREFTDEVLGGVVDEHWLPQSGLLLACDRYVDLETLPLDRKENSVDHTEKADYRVDDLMGFYAADYSLRGSSWQL